MPKARRVSRAVHNLPVPTKRELLQKLQLDANLTLEKLVRQHEAVREQQVQLKSGFQEEGLPVDVIGNRGAGVHSQKFNKRARPINKTTESPLKDTTSPSVSLKCLRSQEIALQS